MTIKRQRCSCSVRYLPEEILSDIFSRLPIKKLLQFQLVCKDWYTNLTNLVSDPFFVNLHHSRINKHQDGSNLIIQCCTSDNLSKLYFVDHENNSSTTPKPSFDINLNLPSKKFKVVGSSNGLLCLCSLPNYETYYICNPFTREVFDLPGASAFGLDTADRDDSTPLGFAFDKITNTYKVVYTWCFFHKIHGYGKLKTGVGIYTLGSRRWRRVEDVPAPFFNRPEISQVLVNGALHGELVSERDEFSNPSSIGAIDIRSENFRAFKMPPQDKRYHVGHQRRILGVLRESLCVFDDISGCNQVYIWIMKDYGISESWQKEYKVLKDMLGPLKYMLGPLESEPLKFFTRKPKTDLFYGDEDQGYYDLEKLEIKRILNNGNQPSSNKVEALVVHLGSLISPRAFDGMAEAPRNLLKLSSVSDQNE